jgi:hypothetical protein
MDNTVNGGITGEIYLILIAVVNMAINIYRQEKLAMIMFSLLMVAAIFLFGKNAKTENIRRKGLSLPSKSRGSSSYPEKISLKATWQSQGRTPRKQSPCM